MGLARLADSLRAGRDMDLALHCGSVGRMIVLPWGLVMHDNHRLMPARPRRGQSSPRLITAPSYRQAKESAELSIVSQWKSRAKMSGEIVLHARLYFPDNRKRDAGNYRKLVTDAMSGICYDDDSQLVSETWERADVDRKNPRIEIELQEPSNGRD